MILTEQFWANVEQDGACWRWTGQRNFNGYGHWRIEGKRYATHRLTFTELRADMFFQEDDLEQVAS